MFSPEVEVEWGPFGGIVSTAATWLVGVKRGGGYRWRWQTLNKFAVASFAAIMLGKVAALVKRHLFKMKL